MKTPVVLIIYHRPEMTKKVIDFLRIVKPKKLFVIADGPKSGRDKKICIKTRALIKSIDWDCTILKRYSNKNMGLRKRVVSGLNWVFKNVDRAIVLEDDLVMDLSFFKFCDELLEKYKNNEEIISISGNNFQFGNINTKASYYFSRYVHSWGWATWKRAWNLYDDKMIAWPKLRQSNWLKTIFNNKILELYWSMIFDLTHDEKVDSWAYRWTYSAFLNNKLTIIPVVNLVSNIGFGKVATHTIKKNKNMDLKTLPVSFPLKHPSKINRNTSADYTTERNIYLSRTIVVSLLFRSLIKVFK